MYSRQLVASLQFSFLSHFHENAFVCNQDDVVQLSAPYITLRDFLSHNFAIKRLINCRNSLHVGGGKKIGDECGA